jgi:glycosyltransferase EpsD
MKKGKVLFSATIAKHILRFHIPYLRWFKENGYEVHAAVNGDEEIPFCDVKHLIPFVRTPYSFAHFKAYRELKEVIDREHYHLIHCHTPMGSVVTRLASRGARIRGTKVLYTAHGFHFYKGGSLFNWLTYYPMEVVLSYFTDAIITINKEDFNVIRKPFAAVSKHLIHGMGVDENRFRPFTAEEKKLHRLLNGLQSTDFVLIYVGEFIPRKNHEFIIRSVSTLNKQIPNVRILFAGRGVLLENMKELAIDLGVSDRINFLGFRDDVQCLMALSDVGISASKQEGLGLNLAEEMLCGLPIVATFDRGHRELVRHGRNGYLFEQGSEKDFSDYVINLYSNPEKATICGQESLKIGKKFTLEKSVQSLECIYKSFLNH